MILGGGSSCQACGCASGCTYDYTPTGYDVADTNQYLAQSIVAPSGGLTLTKATLDVAGYDPLIAKLPPGTYTNYPTCWIYSDSSTQPGSALATLSGPGSLGSSSWEFTGSYSLTGATRYWIVLGKNGWWNFFEIADCVNGNAECCTEPYAYRSTLGGAWNVVDRPGTWQPYLLTIN